VSHFVYPVSAGEFTKDNEWLHQLLVSPLTRPLSFALDPDLCDPEDKKSELEGR
jgi:hypothetical protein